jgi:iron complex outermembrane receptor protein
MKNQCRLLRVPGAALALILAAGVVQATPELPAPEHAGSLGDSHLDEIVVTAEKRTENVQKVPVAVTVVSPAALANAGATQLDQLSKLSPSLTITPEANPSNASIVLRGIGTFAFSIAVEPAVAIIIDDVPQAFQAQAFSTDLIDIDRVEVLRGPQSTLFGKSASAGVINITTKAPTSEFHGGGDVMATTDHEERVAGTLSGPITDKLLFRLTSSYDDYEGSGHDLTNGSRVDGNRQVNVLGRLVWTPLDALKLDIGANHSHIDSDCCISPYIAITPTAGLFRITTPGFTGADVTRGETVNNHNDDIRMDSPTYANSNLAGENAKISYELESGLTLLSVTSHADFSLRDFVDNDFSDLNFIPVYTAGAKTGKYVQYGDYQADSWTQEFRVTSPDSGPIRYVGGLYYQSSDNRRDLMRGPAVSVVNYNAYASSKSYAGFGQATIDIASATRLVAGLRYNKEDIAYTFYKNTTHQVFGQSNSDGVITWRAGLQHDFTPDVMGYAMYTRGYKGQAYDLTSALNAAIAAVQPIKAEKSNSYEIGLRSQFADRRITMNLTGFWTNYSNFQAQGIVPDVTGAAILANVGSVRTRGVELESLFRVTDQFRVTLGVADTNAGILKYPNAACYTAQTAAAGCVGGEQNLAGGVLPDAPRWKANVGGDYTIPFSDLPFDGTLNAYYVYQTKVVYALSQDPATRMAGYGIANLSAGITSHNGIYKASLFVNNLFDTQYYTNIESRASLFGSAPASAGFLPRDFHRYGGVRFSVSF